MKCKNCEREMTETKTIIKDRIKYICSCGKIVIKDDGRK